MPKTVDRMVRAWTRGLDALDKRVAPSSSLTPSSPPSGRAATIPIIRKGGFEGGIDRRQLGGVQEAAWTLLPLTMPEVRRLLWRLVLGRRLLPQEVLCRSHWRRRHQAEARRCRFYSLQFR
jgi:hypothetical protein